MFFFGNLGEKYFQEIWNLIESKQVPKQERLMGKREESNGRIDMKYYFESSVEKRIRNREDSLVSSIVHFMFYWHDDVINTYSVSKTKIISLLI